MPFTTSTFNLRQRTNFGETTIPMYQFNFTRDDQPFNLNEVDELVENISRRFVTRNFQGSLQVTAYTDDGSFTSPQYTIGSPINLVDMPRFRVGSDGITESAISVFENPEHRAIERVYIIVRGN